MDSTSRNAVSSESIPRDGSSSRANSKSSHKLFQKFPFRKRGLREARSQEVITPAEMLPSMNEIVDSAHPSLHRSVSHSSINKMSAEALPEPTWTVHHYQGSGGSDHLTALPAPKNPPRVPLPIAPRVSSANANRNAVAYQNSKQTYGVNDRSNERSRAMNPNADNDDISLRLGTTSIDDPQRPRTPVSAMSFPTPPAFAESPKGESPIVGRYKNSGLQPYSQAEERPVMRGRISVVDPPFTRGPPRQDSFRHERSPAPSKMLSPPASFDSYNVSSTKGPEKIGPDVLAQLQTPSADKSDVLYTELNLADDPDSWDVINPNTRTEEDWDRDFYSLEKRAEQLYSPAHLRLILEDTDFHYRFSTFLRKYRPWRLPILEYYWSTCKAIKALEYANSLAQTLSNKPRLETHKGVISPPGLAANDHLKEAAHAAFDELLRDDLHWYIANTYIGIVGSVMQSRITGTLPAPLREASHGLAEVFCITDPTRRDNPIILASQAFTRHSGCNMDYILGRNCRFMQGPGTTVDSCRRFAISMKDNRDHSEIFVNYRRDGSPFLSLVMNAQLLDSQGNIRYYLGAQVDVSGLLKNCAGLESLTKLVDQQAEPGDKDESNGESTSAIKSLSEMLSGAELDVIGKHGGLLQKGYEHELQQPAAHKKTGGPQRVLLADGSDDSDQGEILPPPAEPRQSQQAPESIPADLTPKEINLSGVYKYYLIVRPAPSLRVLFASPTLRTPGVLQSNFLHRIGGTRMRNDLGGAFQTAEVVTAKVRWLKALSEDGEGEATTRWIHCTPLMHHTGAIGLWMIVVVMPNEKKDGAPSTSSKSDRSSSKATFRPEDRTVRREDRPKPRYVQR